MDKATLKIRARFYKKGWATEQQLMSAVDEYSSTLIEKSKCSTTLPPLTFFKSMKDIRAWIANNDDITDADYDRCRRALNTLDEVLKAAMEKAAML